MGAGASAGLPSGASSKNQLSMVAICASLSVRSPTNVPPQSLLAGHGGMRLFFTASLISAALPFAAS